jgi:hypothetical protein
MRIAMLKIAVTSRWSLAIRNLTSNGKVSTSSMGTRSWKPGDAVKTYSLAMLSS